MNYALKMLGVCAMMATTPIRGCFPAQVDGIKYVSRNISQDVFLAEKLKSCTPDKKARILNKLKENLREDHISDVNPIATINATLRGDSCP